MLYSERLCDWNGIVVKDGKQDRVIALQEQKGLMQLGAIVVTAATIGRCKSHGSAASCDAGMCYEPSALVLSARWCTNAERLMTLLGLCVRSIRAGKGK